MMFIGWGDGNYYSSLNGGALTITGKSFVGATTLTIGQQAGEVVMYNDFLEQPSRQILEGYLARKWNIVNNIPTTHPYYSTAPTLDTLKDIGALSIPTIFPTLTMWLDAADTTFTGTQWLDKSPIGDVFRANGTNPLPVFSTISASGPSIPGVFFGGQASLIGTVPTGMSNGTGTTFLVCSLATLTVTAGAIVNGNPSGLTSDSFMILNNTAATNDIVCPSQSFGTPNGSFNIIFLETTGVRPNVYFVSMSNDGTGAGAINFQTPVNNSWNPTSFSSSPWCLGSPDPIFPLQNFYLHEFLTFSTKLTTTQQQTVEGYLAWKWGIQTLLPAAHPFKNSRPL
jgi:hypothetical protein